jgi:hypothetical protein
MPVSTTVSDEDLLHYNKLGLIPGPSENEVDFLKRVDHCLHLKENMASHLGQQFAIEIDNPVSEELIHNATPVMCELFDIAPNWVPIIFTDHHLAPWHGGCAWIFQFTDDSPVGAFFQLRRVFASSMHYLWIYDRDELITHESAHVGRMVFEEPRFEELLAYRTAKSRFRRWFGPIIQSAWEGGAFFFSLLIVLLVDIYFFTEQVQNTWILWFKVIPVLLLSLGLVRLWRKQKQFNKCLSNLENILGDKHRADSVIYRLQDQEIINFSKMPSKEILKYVEKNKTLSLRWRAIVAAYFRNP